MTGLEKKHLYYTTTSPSILYDFFKRVMVKFDRDYWVTHCGQDAYLYLLLQRKLMRLAILTGVLSLIVSFSANLFTAPTQEEWFTKSSLNFKEFTTPLSAWIHVCLIIFITAITFYTVFELREEARELYKESWKEKCKVKDDEWLKARTLHVRGVLPKDRRGDMLKNELNLLLQPVKGQVLDVVVIPDFQRLFDLEMEKKEVEDIHALTNAAHGNPPTCTKGCFRSLWTLRAGSFEKIQQELDSQIEKEIEKPF